MTKSINKNHKNSLIELMRFFFALWVLYYHGYFPYRADGFNGGFLAVEFFFVLSGFYLVRSIDKYTALPTQKGLLTFLKHRFLPIAIPFLINEIFSLYYYFYSASFLSTDPFGYLWYIRELFLMMSAIFILRKFVTNQKKFYGILAGLSAITLIIFWIFPSITHVGTLRALIAIPIGMLIALVPKLEDKKDGSLRGKLPSWIIALGLAFSVLICLQIAYMPKTAAVEYILKILVYPAMIYFASCVNFNCSFLNWLGSLSFPIYSFQCVLRVLELHGITNVNHMFALIVIIVLAFSLISNIVKAKQVKI